MAEEEEYVKVELKPRLRDLLRVRDELRDEVFAYNKLEGVLESNSGSEGDVQVPMESLVSIGNGVRVQAKVNDTSGCYVHVGIGFHVELKASEVLAVSQKRRALLARRVAMCEAEVQSTVLEIENALASAAQKHEEEQARAIDALALDGN